MRRNLPSYGLWRMLWTDVYGGYIHPMIPFVVPITVSYVVVMVLGNPLVMLV